MHELTLEKDRAIMESNAFALLEFDKALTMLQQKLYYMAMAEVRRGEDPESQVMYRLDISSMADLNDTPIRNIRKSVKRVVPQLADMNVKLRTSYVESGKLHILFNIFQEIAIDLHNPNIVDVRFNYEFRKQILKMKKEHDIEYPTRTIMSLRGKYSISIYTYLIAEASLIRNDRSLNTEDSFNENYIIEVTKEKLFARLNYTAPLGDFNRRILPEMVTDLNNHSELYISDYDIIRNGRTVEKYRFHIHIETTIKTPIFSRSLLSNTNDMVPPMEYLEKRLREIGVGESIIKKFQIQKHPDRARIWTNLLYTWLWQGRNPRYFNAAYTNDYFRNTESASLERLFRVVAMRCPQFMDDYMKSIDDEYTKRGVPYNPEFVDEAIKHLQNYKKRASRK